ncbi:MAG TPA: MarR family winged helix-turn-helix transcriptional regulator [Streptosporangiaceae bacterium]|nr:MarR family winged helix-turn-helix transcriptional regulator [Streptosporangiaceae bacterium]
MAEAAGAAAEEAAGAAAAGAGRPATAGAAGVAAAGVAAAGTAAVGAAEPVGGVAETPGFELPLRLLLAFRVLIDELHAELARRGHPDMRPMHGFVFQAIGPGGTTAAELGRRLGISKQAAGKTIDTLEQLGYTERGPDPGDARRKVVRLTDRAVDALALSARIFDDLRARWAEILGTERLRALEADLRLVTPLDPWRLDVPGWFGGQ